MGAKFFKVYYRCKVGGNGSSFAVSGKTNKKAAIIATYSQMSMRDRSGYYMPICYSITEEEFKEHTKYNEGRDFLRWN